MSATLKKMIGTIHGTPNGWVHVERIRKDHSGLVISLVVRRGRRGRLLHQWHVRCRGVREFKVCDLDGGGIRLYPASHPAARQYGARMMRLQCYPKGDLRGVVGALVAAHVEAVDDWIPIDRYIPVEARDRELVVVAPEFLVRAYARTLRKLGLPARVSTSRRVVRTAQRSKVLHFGSSFVVAESFEITPGAERLENNRLQRTSGHRKVEPARR